MTSRERMPDVRRSVTRTLRIGDETIYAVLGFYEDNRPGELFLYGDRVGTMAHGLLDGLALAVSVGLQHGVPLSKLVEKFRHMRFEPSGFTKDAFYPTAASWLDLLAQWLDDVGVTHEVVDDGVPRAD